MNDNNDSNRLSYSPRISRIKKSSNFTNTSIINHPLSPMVFFSLINLQIILKYKFYLDTVQMSIMLLWFFK